MTEIANDPLNAQARAMLAKYSALEFADLFADGFKAYAAGDSDTLPFGPVYAFLFGGEDITDDFAAVYQGIGYGAKAAFSKGLAAAVRRLDAMHPIDQRALKFLIRLGAKIECFELLPIIARKIFESDIDESPELISLRSMALDAAIELAAGHPEAGDYLRDVVQSRLFRPSVAATMLLALCEVESDNLIEHLFLLEDALVDLYGDISTFASEELLYSRALLVTDVSDFVLPGVLGSVVDFALANRAWPLAWIGDILLSAPALASLGGEDAIKAGELREDLLARHSRPAAPPPWAHSFDTPRPTASERREAFDILNAGEFDREAEDVILKETLKRLGAQRQPFAASEVLADSDTAE